MIRKTIVATMILVGISSAVNAQSNPSFAVNVISQSDSGLRVIIHNPEEKRLMIRITHPLAGNVVDTTISGKDYACLYHFDNAEDGRYKIVVSDGKEKYRKNLELRTVTTVSRSIEVERE